jgi:hypothetical protein
VPSNRPVEAPRHEGASRNVSEPTVEASKRYDGSGQPPRFGEACTDGERINARRSSIGQ